MIKAVFIDIDGTILNSYKETSTRTKIAIEKCIKNGIKIILTSGRSRYDTLRYQKELKTSPFIISSNGANVYDIIKENEVYSSKLKSEYLIELLEYSEKNNCKFILNYASNQAMNTYFYEEEKHKVKSIEELKTIISNENVAQCIISSKDLETIIKAKEYVERNKSLKIENESKRITNPSLQASSSYYCDIVSSNVSKGEAVNKLCSYLKLERDEIVTIGDGINDISMFKQTPNSVAMGNAMDVVKNAAKYITATNDEDGVAKFLENL